MKIRLPTVSGKNRRIRYDFTMSTLNLPPGHSLITTDDGSYTLFSEAFQEACHSTTGAKTETILHYLDGCQIISKSECHHPLVILEVGFGLGVGLLTTLEKVSPENEIHFLSLELDKNLLEWFRGNHPEFNFNWEKNILQGEFNKHKITIIQGNARDELPRYLKEHQIKWHAIYQDAFSPKKNPVLWTKEWFELLREHSAQDVILSTYSASSSIRKGLHETGWGAQKGEKFGKKRTSTRAVLNKAADPEILFQLERSPVAALSDLQLE